MGGAIATRYAKAWMQRVLEEKTLDAALSDAALLGDTLRESRELSLFLKSPIHGKDTKKQVLDAVFGSSLSKVTVDLIDLMIQKGRAGSIGDVAAMFQHMHKEAAGLLDVQVETAVELGVSETATLTAALSKLTGKTVTTHADVKPDLIGGVKVRIGDQVIDGTVKHQLERLRQEFDADLAG
jgi:F-type H+-transporting ATPase subunit delta